MLTQKARYALRALIHLAGQDGGQLTPISAIASAQDVPYKYLESVMADLGRAAIVSSRRGPRGGYALARPPIDICFTDILRAVDGPIALVPCASENFYRSCGDCREEATCSIRAVMGQVRDAAVAVMDGVTLADAAAMEARTG